MSNIILLSLIGLGLITSFSFIYSVKGEFTDAKKITVDGNSSLTTKQIDIPDFANVKVYDQIEVVIKQGPKSVEISAEGNLIEYIKVIEKDGYLEAYIDAGGNQIKWNGPLIVTVSNPVFLNIIAKKQSFVKVSGMITQDDIHLEMRDQSNFNGKLIVENITINTHQQSNANVQGKAANMELTVRDQSGVRAGSFEVKKAKVRLSQQTDARLLVKESIIGEIDDNATLTLNGNPEIENIRKYNQAEIHKGWK